jgi:hypothetical protein
MPKPRLPKAKADASGAAIKNPGRFKDRKAPKRTRPLGEPYSAMTEDQRRYWREFAVDMPWLHSGHRVLLRMACQFAARLDTDDGIGENAAKVLSALLSKLGATPVDETKVNHGDDGEEDPADQFFGRPH